MRSPAANNRARRVGGGGGLLPGASVDGPMTSASTSQSTSGCWWCVGMGFREQGAQARTEPGAVARIHRETVGDVIGAIDEEEKIRVIDDAGLRVARGGELQARQGIVHGGRRRGVGVAELRIL